MDVLQEVAVAGQFREGRAVQTVAGFDASEDLIDFNALGASDVAVSEVDGDLVFEVLGNGGHTLTLNGVQAEDLTSANLTAESWNTITEPGSALILELEALGMTYL